MSSNYEECSVWPTTLKRFVQTLGVFELHVVEYTIFSCTNDKDGKSITITSFARIRFHIFLNVWPVGMHDVLP